MVESALETRGPVNYATLAILLTLLPLAALKGEVGAFVPSIAYSYAIAVVVALVIAITATPLLSLLLLRGKAMERREAPLVSRLRAVHDLSLIHI